ncbi:MAG TPA: S41 family peptidase [Fibrobacteria bacterium]|nr:S41 family peptidase [Fibrobacteria bacterium]HOX50690.1 S41 family peptidase [Fibrobacteria bacterium]
MSLPSRSNIYFALATAIVAVSSTAAVSGSSRESGFYSSFERLGKVLVKINDVYVEEIPSDSMTEAAVRGMSSILDPHTAYFAEKESEDLKIHTQAKFGGLGITIGIRENVLTVISPLSGTPAQRMGIQAGDRILEIDGKATRGITVDDAVSKLRGTPGTQVTIKVWREGFTQPMPYTITREIINIESVPYAGMLPGKVGYVKLVQFSEPTGEELEKALLDLKAKGATSFILDLRYNPGGLLTQAVSVSEMFLPKGRLVVSTKGRIMSQNTEMGSQRDPIVDTGAPLVVLVNGGSASAAEIVSGAIQDWDRGVVLGTQTFGKGSVQTIFPMDQKHLLKVTTAFYYTPSGRCINKKENGVRWLRDQADDSAKTDSAKPAKGPGFDDDLGAEIDDGSAPDTTLDTLKHKSFRTKILGRKVWDAGGILPDVRVTGRRLNSFQQDLERKNLFFRFAIYLKPKLLAKGKLDTSFRATDAQLEEFRRFLQTDSVKFSFDSPEARLLKEIRKSVKRDSLRGEKYQGPDRAAIRSRLDALDSALSKANESLFSTNRDYIREGINREVLMAVGGTRGSTPYELSLDPQVAEAVKLLRDPARYRQVLTKPKAAPAK